MIIENRVECETCDAVLEVAVDISSLSRISMFEEAMDEAGWRTVSNWMDLCPLCSKENALSTIKKGTIVIVINGGLLREVYCVGEMVDYILVYKDDQAVDKVLIREGRTLTAIDEAVKALIVIERRRRDAE